MPELARFYGVVVRMYYADHPPPHFHAYYSGAEAVISISDLFERSGSTYRCLGCGSTSGCG